MDDQPTFDFEGTLATGSGQQVDAMLMECRLPLLTENATDIQQVQARDSFGSFHCQCSDSVSCVYAGWRWITAACRYTAGGRPAGRRTLPEELETGGLESVFAILEFVCLWFVTALRSQTVTDRQDAQNTCF